MQYIIIICLDTKSSAYLLIMNITETVYQTSGINLMSAKAAHLTTEIHLIIATILEKTLLQK